MADREVTTWDANWKRAVLTWALVLAYMALIYALSDQPDLPKPPGIGPYDKLQHVVAYFGLGLLTFRSAVKLPLSRRMGPYIETLLVTSVYGALDELHQSFVPVRSADLADWAANVTGAVLALILIAVLRRKRANGGKRHGRAGKG